MGEVGEVKDGGVSLDAQGGGVVGARRHFGVRECAEPDSGFLAGLANFGHPFAPAPHSNPSVNWVSVAVSPSLVPFFLSFDLVGRVGNRVGNGLRRRRPARRRRRRRSRGSTLSFRTWALPHYQNEKPTSNPTKKMNTAVKRRDNVEAVKREREKEREIVGVCI